MLYFAYGSNLCAADLARWCREAGAPPIRLTRIASGVLRDRRLAFTHRSATRGGGVLDVPEATRSSAPGVLFEIDDADSVRTLDRKESSGHTYRRIEAVAFYVLVYGLMNVLLFAALPPDPDDAARDRLANLKGLFRRDRFAALMIAVAMLSLAGIPPFPGFIAKFLIFKNVMAAGFTLYAVLGLVGSYLGIYFYLRVIQFLFMTAEEQAAITLPPAAPISPATTASDQESRTRPRSKLRPTAPSANPTIREASAPQNWSATVLLPCHFGRLV